MALFFKYKGPKQTRQN